MVSWIAFDRFSRLRAFPYDRFKIDMIVPIVRIELNSIQAIKVVSELSGSFAIVWVAFPYDRPDRRNIIEKLGRSGRSYAKGLYIGETIRNLSMRLTEHKRATRNGDINNHIAEHCYVYGCFYHKFFRYCKFV